jgi:hypothetical protein
MPVINCCGQHLIGIITDKGEIGTLPYSGSCARANFNQIRVDEVDGIPIYRNGDAMVKGLPGPTPGTVYVTSRLVAEYVKRPDVCCPNSAPGHVIRDEYGMPVAVDSLLTYGRRVA